MSLMSSLSTVATGGQPVAQQPSLGQALVQPMAATAPANPYTGIMGAALNWVQNNPNPAMATSNYNPQPLPAGVGSAGYTPQYQSGLMNSVKKIDPNWESNDPNDRAPVPGASNSWIAPAPGVFVQDNPYGSSRAAEVPKPDFWGIREPQNALEQRMADNYWAANITRAGEWNNWGYIQDPFGQWVSVPTGQALEPGYTPSQMVSSVQRSHATDGTPIAPPAGGWPEGTDPGTIANSQMTPYRGIGGAISYDEYVALRQAGFPNSEGYPTYYGPGYVYGQAPDPYEGYNPANQGYYPWLASPEWNEYDTGPDWNLQGGGYELPGNEWNYPGSPQNPVNPRGYGWDLPLPQFPQLNVPGQDSQWYGPQPPAGGGGGGGGTPPPGGGGTPPPGGGGGSGGGTGGYDMFNPPNYEPYMFRPYPVEYWYTPPPTPTPFYFFAPTNAYSGSGSTEPPSGLNPNYPVNPNPTPPNTPPPTGGEDNTTPQSPIAARDDPLFNEDWIEPANPTLTAWGPSDWFNYLSRIYPNRDAASIRAMAQWQMFTFNQST